MPSRARRSTWSAFCCHVPRRVAGRAGRRRLRHVAIVDRRPRASTCCPEFLLLPAAVRAPRHRRVDLRPGRTPPRPDGLSLQGRPVDLVYNRLTDFALEPGQRRAARSLAGGTAVITPHPRAHAPTPTSAIWCCCPTRGPRVAWGRRSHHRPDPGRVPTPSRRRRGPTTSGPAGAAVLRRPAVSAAVAPTGATSSPSACSTRSSPATTSPRPSIAALRAAGGGGGRRWISRWTCATTSIGVRCSSSPRASTAARPPTSAPPAAAFAPVLAVPWMSQPRRYFLRLPRTLTP